MQPATVLVVDDHPLIREGVLASLAGAPDLEVVGEAADGLEAEEKACELRPDIVLLDIGLPIRDGVETARAIRASLSDTKIIILTAWAEPERLVEAVDAGADGYVLKDMSADELVSALRSAVAGEPPLAGAT